MILVDTSAWVDFFRGRGAHASRVQDLIERNDAALCGPIVTELRRGIQARHRKKVLPLLDSCHSLLEPDHMWREAGDLGYSLARKGVTVKTLDLLIATHALAHNVPLLTHDADFEAMKRAGIDLVLV